MRISDWSSDVCSSDLVWFRRLDLRDHAREVGAAHRLIFFARQGQLVVLDMLLEDQVRGAREDIVRSHEEIFLEAFFLARSEEHTSELQSLMRISYAVFCLKKKQNIHYYFMIHI